MTPFLNATFRQRIDSHERTCYARVQYAAYISALPNMNADNDELRQFLIILRQALLMIVSWIERKYNLKQPTAK